MGKEVINVRVMSPSHHIHILDLTSYSVRVYSLLEYRRRMRLIAPLKRLL